MNLRTIIVAAALVLPLSAAPASAQFLTFVSAAGNDANTCFVQAAPCKTLQRTINQTSPSGEVRLLTSIVSNGFINKSITVEGSHNTVIGTIAVNSASAIVRFKRLNLNGVNGFPTGFNLINAAAIHFEECSAERYTGDGIFLASNVSTELFISDTVSRDNGDVGLQADGPTTAKVSIETSRWENNAFGVAISGGRAAISDSVFFGSTFSGLVVNNGATANITNSIAPGNGDAGFFTSGVAETTLESCEAVGNTFHGIFVGATGTSARISDCVSTGSATGITNDFATIQTLGNNLIAGNTANVNGTLTPLTPE
jgi:hypothetical protein